MKRPTKSVDGMYHIHGKKYPILIGSRAQVEHGNAFKTPGGLKKGDLLMNKNGHIVSRKKHFTAKKEKRLEKAGYKTKKGVFNLSKKHSRKHKSRKA
jgi:hypothetical protein